MVMATAACPRPGGQRPDAPETDAPRGMKEQAEAKDAPETGDGQAQEQAAAGAQQGADYGHIEVSNAARTKAETIFKQRCVVCHGSDGTGSGPGAAALNPKPRDYTEVSWQESVTDAELAKAIIGGGGAVGKSALMPANPDLKSKPQVVQGIINKIRSFAGKGGKAKGDQAAAKGKSKAQKK